ncbi:tetratricopeptide repeat protein 7A [Tachysurus ichikawai]
MSHGGMSARLSLSLYRIEAEIERCRAECQWDRIQGLVEQLAAARFHEDDDYGLLLQAEALLENCLLENVALLRSSTPLSEHTQPKLAQAKGHLNSLLSRGRLEPRYLNEALLLLAKVHYAQGNYRDAQGMCARAGIEEFTRDEQPLYHLRLLAEAFVIKGLSLDHQTVSAASRIRLSEREEECLSCYLQACDTALHYLQEAFCPQDVVEEAVLLLLITESMASGEAVISRTPEHKEAREASIQDASSVYDLLSISMARRGQYGMLSECLERAMKFSFSEFHLWYQLGLSLMASGKNEAAVSVLKECARMKPQDPTPPLLAAKVCINQLHWLDEAEALAKSVIALGEGAEESLARAHLTIGLCYSLQASDAILKGDRDEFNRQALHTLQTAHVLDPHDPQIALYLSLQLALVRQVSAAMEPLQLALNLRSDDLHSLHLLVLLLSAQKHYQHALDTLILTLSQYPDNFNLLFTKVKLEEALYGPAVALQTCEEMLRLWQTHYDFPRPSETDDNSSIPPPEPGPLSRKPSGLNLTLPDFQETETGSQSAPSLAVSRLEQVLSEGSAVSSIQRHGPAHIWTTLERIWLQAGELFMADGRLKEAQFCVQEAGALFPTSHSVLLLKGRLAERRGNDTEAKSLYDEALAINPRGHHILIHLGKLLVRMGRVGLGEKVLRDAVQTHSLAHEAWSGLGEALQTHGSAQAPDCFLTALDLESSCPIRPFTIIPREL